ncbi:MAG: hypothetical protein Q9160_004142 [Pyrenula sp. 1 TL-2023]
MLDQLPYEIRVEIFQHAFPEKHGFECPVLHVKKSERKPSFQWLLQRRRFVKPYGGLLFCLTADIFDRYTATAALEALYRSNFKFSIDADLIPDFLWKCSLGTDLRAGRFVSNIIVHMDEDPRFSGDGKEGVNLRKADWVDSDEEGSLPRKTPNITPRTYVMRKCWQALLRMPELLYLQISILPSQGKVSRTEIKSWELRDVVPTCARLRGRGVTVCAYLRTWEQFHQPQCLVTQQECQQNWSFESDGRYESHIDLTPCLPFPPRLYAHNQKEMEEDRVAAEFVMEHGLTFDVPKYSSIPSSSRFHKVTNEAAVLELVDRLEADKGFERIDRDYRRIHKKRQRTENLPDRSRPHKRGRSVAAC